MVEDTKIIKEKTKYAATIEKEFEKSINLLPGESIEFKKRGIVFTGKLILQSPGLVVLTNKRIIFLMHHPFGPDKLLYIPLSVISKINFKKLGFFRSSQPAINLQYDNRSIIFAVTYVQKFATGFGGPEATLEFFKLLQKKLPTGIVDETTTPTKYYDYYLFLAGLVIGYIIGGILPILLSAGLGFLIGKLINKLTK